MGIHFPSFHQFSFIDKLTKLKVENLPFLVRFLCAWSYSSTYLWLLYNVFIKVLTLLYWRLSYFSPNCLSSCLPASPCLFSWHITGMENCLPPPSLANSSEVSVLFVEFSFSLFQYQLLSTGKYYYIIS